MWVSKVMEKVGQTERAPSGHSTNNSPVTPHRRVGRAAGAAIRVGTGRWPLLQDLATGVRHNHPTARVVFLLIDQAPASQTSDNSSIAASLRLARTYSELLTKRPVIEETLARLGLDTSLESTGSSIQVQLLENTFIHFSHGFAERRSSDRFGLGQEDLHCSALRP